MQYSISYLPQCSIRNQIIIFLKADTFNNIQNLRITIDMIRNIVTSAKATTLQVLFIVHHLALALSTPSASDTLRHSPSATSGTSDIPEIRVLPPRKILWNGSYAFCGTAHEPPRCRSLLPFFLLSYQISV